MDDLSNRVANSVAHLVNLTGNADLRVRGSALEAAASRLRECQAIVKALSEGTLVVTEVEKQEEEGDVDAS